MDHNSRLEHKRFDGMDALQAWLNASQDDTENLFDRRDSILEINLALGEMGMTDPKGPPAPWSAEALSAAAELLQEAWVDQGFVERLGALSPKRAQAAAALIELAEAGVIPREAMERAAADLEERMADAKAAAAHTQDPETQGREMAQARDLAEALYLANASLDGPAARAPTFGGELTLGALDARRWTKERAQKEAAAEAPSMRKGPGF